MKTGSKKVLNVNFYAYLFVAPFLLGILAFTLYPIIYMIYLSFTNTAVLAGVNDFVGFNNYAKILTSQKFLTSIGTTWKIWLCNFIPQIGISLLLAVWFTSVRLKLKAVGVFRAIFYLPNLLMPATIAVLFTTFLGVYGPINQVLVRSGILDSAMDFQRYGNIMQGTVSFIQWWMWFGQTVIIIMAGMTSISPSLYESAIVDGASGGKIFVKITLPLLKPILLYVLITSLVGGMQMFDIPYLMTDGKGAPDGALATMNVFMYNYLQTDDRYIGLASTVGMCIFVITVTVAMILFFLMRNRSDEPKKKKKGGC